MVYCILSSDAVFCLCMLIQDHVSKMHFNFVLVNVVIKNYVYFVFRHVLTVQYSCLCFFVVLLH